MWILVISHNLYYAYIVSYFFGLTSYLNEKTDTLNYKPTYVDLHVRCLIFLFILTNVGMCHHILLKIQNTKFK
jgi:hypothetical protein